MTAFPLRIVAATPSTAKWCHHHLARCLNIYLLLTLALAPLAAKAQESEHITPQAIATDLSLTPAVWLHGMVERRVAIANNGSRPISAALAHRVSLYESGKSYQQTYQQALVAIPGGRTVATVYQPFPIGSMNLTITDVSVPGYKKKTLSGSSPNISHKYTSHSPLNLLLSRGLSAEELKNRLLAIATAKKGSGSYFRTSEIFDHRLTAVREELRSEEAMKNLTPCRFEGEGSAWPRHWLAFSSFDGCLIAASDYSLMPAETRQALFDYTAAGGHVTFFGMAALPDDWPAMAAASRQADKLSPTDAADSMTAQSVNIGLGRAVALPQTSLRDLDDGAVTTLFNAWTETLYRWLSRHESPSANNSAIPIVNNISVPLQGFLFVLLVFVLLAGPGVIIYTHRTKRRMLMLLLVPAVSLTFSVVVIVWALFSEGITPTLRRQALTLLDQRTQRAVTYGAIGVYTPVSLRDGLHFDIGTEIAPLSKRRNSTTIVGADNHLRSGWAQPRVPIFFQLRRSETRAERLVVNEVTGGTVEVVNALGAPINRLRLCDRNGNLYETDTLAPGEKRLLRLPTPRPATAAAFMAVAAPAKNVHADAGWDITANAAKLSAAGMDSVTPEPGAYLAVLDGAPFIENPLAYCRTKGSAISIMMGWY